jgi:hypothetical protein
MFSEDELGIIRKAVEAGLVRPTKVGKPVLFPPVLLPHDEAFLATFRGNYDRKAMLAYRRKEKSLDEILPLWRLAGTENPKEKQALETWLACESSVQNF